MKIQSNHSLIEAIRCKQDNNDVSKKTLSKISEKFAQAADHADGLSRENIIELHDEIEKIKVNKARSKLDSLIDKLVISLVKSENRLDESTHIALLNMGIKQTAKVAITDSDEECRWITANVGEIATAGQNNESLKSEVLKTLEKINQDLVINDITLVRATIVSAKETLGLS